MANIDIANTSLGRRKFLGLTGAAFWSFGAPSGGSYVPP